MGPSEHTSSQIVELNIVIENGQNIRKINFYVPTPSSIFFPYG